MKVEPLSETMNTGNTRLPLTGFNRRKKELEVGSGTNSNCKARVRKIVKLVGFRSLLGLFSVALFCEL